MKKISIGFSLFLISLLFLSSFFKKKNFDLEESEWSFFIPDSGYFFRWEKKDWSQTLLNVDPKTKDTPKYSFDNRSKMKEENLKLFTFKDQSDLELKNLKEETTELSFSNRQIASCTPKKFDLETTKNDLEVFLKKKIELKIKKSWVEKLDLFIASETELFYGKPQSARPFASAILKKEKMENKFDQKCLQSKGLGLNHSVLFVEVFLKQFEYTCETNIETERAMSCI